MYYIIQNLSLNVRLKHFYSVPHFVNTSQTTLNNRIHVYLTISNKCFKICHDNNQSLGRFEMSNYTYSSYFT